MLKNIFGRSKMRTDETLVQSSSDFFSYRTLNLCTLCGFAITQPLLIALEQQAVYLHDEQVDWLEVGILMAVLLLILPLGFVALDQLALRLSRLTRGFGRNAVFFILSSAMVLSLLRPYIALQWMVREGFACYAAFSIAFICARQLVLLYERFSPFRLWLNFAAVGLIVFPSSFLWQFHAIRRAEIVSEKRIEVRNPVPVVFVVFDEFNATTLMNEKMEIDSNRFPGFGRLAECSTWYRNMTTVHPRTGTAVPAILSGRFPLSEEPPLGAEYPGNLFQVIDSSKLYDMAVFEPATRLCPRSHCRIPEPPRPLTQRCVDLIHTLAAVYPRLIFTNDSPIYFPTIPKAWFGIHINSVSANSNYRELTEGLFAYNRGLNRNGQLDHFLKCILPSEKPRFCFIHAMIPHYPWTFLPNGHKYQAETFFAHGPPVGQGELGEHWPDESNVALRYEHRYRLQVGYVDRFIERLLDQLEKSNVMDGCLLIVTADHGVAFRPGHSRRVPDADNIAEIMSVPLFIKLPGQTKGEIDERNVETVDLLPTVADVLGIDLPESVDGIAVSEDSRRPRKTIYFEKSMTIVQPDFPQRTATVRRQANTFGTDPLERLPILAVSRPEWIGRPVKEFRIADDSVEYHSAVPLMAAGNEEDLKETTITHRLLCGSLILNASARSHNEVVLTMDGVVQDCYRMGPTSSRNPYFEFFLPETLSPSVSERIDLYLVEESTDGMMLRPLRPNVRP